MLIFIVMIVTIGVIENKVNTFFLYEGCSLVKI